MKARHIILCVICIIAVAMGILFFCALEKHNGQLAKIARLPDVALITVDGNEFNLSELRPERKVVLLFFSPDCEFCRKELKGILSHRGKFDGVDWIFVTISPIEELMNFLSEYPLDSILGAKVCIEDSPELFMAFDVTSPPSIFIYDADGTLENYKRGAVSIKTILEWIR